MAQHSIPKRNENVCLHSNLDTHVHSSMIHNGPQMETTQMSIHWTDEQNVVFPHSGTLFGNKREWRTDTCHHMHGPRKHDAELKNPDTKEHMFVVWCHLYEVFRIGKSIEMESSLVLAQSWVLEWKVDCSWARGFFFAGTELFQNYTVVMVTQFGNSRKTI